MASTTRVLRCYDHRLRDLVRSVGDIGHATRRGVPRSTARGWLSLPHAEVVTLDVVDWDVLSLQREVLALRKRVEWLIALLRLVVVMLKVSGFSLARTRIPDAALKALLIRAIDRSRTILPLRAALRLLRLSQSYLSPTLPHPNGRSTPLDQRRRHTKPLDAIQDRGQSDQPHVVDHSLA